ncbi:hypothetical protein BJ875DRAFT_253370 [Amylocarpus encephaloides]|uniref:DUF6594 domain-containing protein n=1 Tax=Amylocarpus encephaloides TaxID=45428 RepID=A0A9P7Y7P8_9HELO|nr:hypothetical protein BJ875DRAFT_253370 [Amylocarpus encephaloides]
MRLFSRRSSDFDAAGIEQTVTAAISKVSPSPTNPAPVNLPTYPVHAKFLRKSSTSSNGKDSQEPAQRSVRAPVTSTEAKMLLEDYDLKTSNIGDIFPVRDHNAMVKAMFLDSIQYQTAKLCRHIWILKSRNKHYKELQTIERCDMIQDDLGRYVRFMETYERWLKCTLPETELEPNNPPSSVRTLGRTLAMIECAQHHGSNSDKEIEPSVLTELSRPFFKSYNPTFLRSSNSWATAKPFSKVVKERARSQARISGLVPRSIMATLGGGALIVPILAMVLDPKMISTLLTTSAFVLPVGLVVACWMNDEQVQDIVTAMVVYAAVWAVLLACENGI